MAKELLAVTAFFYLLAFGAHLLSFSGKGERGNRAAFRLMQAGFICATFYFVMEAATLGTFVPVIDASHALAFFAWSLAFVYLVLLAKAQSESFGLVLTPVLVFLLGMALFGAHVRRGNPLPPAHPLFMLHILSAFFAYASFAISFAAGVLYLIQRHELKSKHAGTFYHKLPALEDLERLIDQPMGWGALLLAGAVAIGFAWSKAAYGAYWFSDPKTLITVFVTLAYGTVLFLRLGSHLRARQAAIFSVAAFALVILSFIGTRFLHGSHHFLA
ncbi:MAG: hypothetical protein A2Y02_02410 [Omnitrophica bacterium GWA2_52_12]|nr:MAG: hypothetical protein A2Y02_02410 [Omnitrophica bacterium GWA2_52_12]